MVTLEPVAVAGGTAVGITVELPRTRLVILSGSLGYLMCGALDVELLDTRLRQREIVAGRAVGVRTVDELLAAPLERVTGAAERLGLHAGMTGRDALALLVGAERGGTDAGAKARPGQQDGGAVDPAVLETLKG